MQLENTSQEFLSWQNIYFNFILQHCVILYPTPSSQIPGLFHMYVKYIYIYECIYMHKFINTTCWVCSVLLVCIISGLTTWCWTTKWELILGKTSSPSLIIIQLLVAYSSLSRVLWVLSRQPCCWGIMGQAFLLCLRDTVLQQIYKFSTLVPWCSHALHVGAGLSMYPPKLGTPWSMALCILTSYDFL